MEKSEVDYLLVCLTHGGHDRDLALSLQAFVDNVTPLPHLAFLHADAPDFDPWQVLKYFPLDWQVGSTDHQHGFCYSTRACWREGAFGPCPYVFHLEADFLIDRPLDLNAVAAVLAVNPQLAQMQLMRNAVSSEEIRAGGLFQSRPGQYEPRDATRTPWLEHRSYLSTNPCLMRRSFMAEHPWPTYSDQCEGRFGIDLVAAGYRFGVWGDGSPWTTHIGSRDGTGY